MLQNQKIMKIKRGTKYFGNPDQLISIFLKKTTDKEWAISHSAEK